MKFIVPTVLKRNNKHVAVTKLSTDSIYGDRDDGDTRNGDTQESDGNIFSNILNIAKYVEDEERANEP